MTMQAYNFTNSSLETQCLFNLLPRNFEELLQPLCLLSMLCDTHRLLGVPGLSPRRPHVTVCFMDDRRWYLCKRPQISAPYCRRWTTSEPYSTLIFFLLFAPNQANQKVAPGKCTPLRLSNKTSIWQNVARPRHSKGRTSSPKFSTFRTKLKRYST